MMKIRDIIGYLQGRNNKYMKTTEDIQDKQGQNITDTNKNKIIYMNK